ncbi:MAG: hypothetical protein P4L99_05650, partial [Chthoniobacter sp.]|nr:hypothetical protein [Chthoniobacter sp.]
MRAVLLGAGHARYIVLPLLPVFAQQVRAQEAVPTPPTTPTNNAAAPEITVSGQRSPVVTAIDRKSYSLRNNLQATTGSAIDVMRNLPSVTVDEDGNPSLRGDANVQILIDGRP